MTKKEYQKQWYLQNKERLQEKARQHRKDNLEYYREYDRKRRLTPKRLQQKKDSNRRCSSRVKDYHKKYSRQYLKENRGKVNANTAKYRASKDQRTPMWANLEKIKEIYRNCPKGYHVDHIIPLRGDTVSGLHVESNLQYLLAEENMKKNNRL